MIIKVKFTDCVAHSTDCVLRILWMAHSIESVPIYRMAHILLINRLHNAIYRLRKSIKEWIVYWVEAARVCTSVLFILFIIVVAMIHNYKLLWTKIYRLYVSSYFSEFRVVQHIKLSSCCTQIIFLLHMHKLSSCCTHFVDQQIAWGNL